MNSDSQQEGKNISVIIRIKAKTSEDKNKKYFQIKVSNSNSISIISKKKDFFYDYIADENSSQTEIFEQCGKKICDNALEGYNATIFAYGQTGSGKTYTLLGKSITNKLENRSNNISAVINTNSEDVEMNDINNDINYYYDKNDERIGLLPRILYYLFDNSSKDGSESKFIFKISYMEIYMENLKDLLNPNNKNIKLSDVNGVLDIKNLRKLIISSPEEAIKYIIDGNHFRHTGQTLMNSESSRSHAIISIYIENNLIKENKIKKSVFHIIDLAGSERQKKTESYGDRVKEAGAINKSLLNLSIVIKNIISNQKQIPYRDSKLTHILRDSLGGNAKTSIIATISQLECNLEESVSTLNFAQNAKLIKNNAIINEELSANDAKILKEKFKNLQMNYNSIFEKYAELKKEYQNQRNTLYEKESISKSIQIQNEDINRMMKESLEKEEELKKLREENDALKDKIDKNDIAFKLRDADIRVTKIRINNLNDEKNKLLTENIELKNQIKNLNEEISEKNEYIKNINEKHKNELLDIDKNYKNLQNQNSLNDSLLNEFKEKIKQYEDQLNKMNIELNKSKKKIEDKDINLKEASNLLSQKEGENKLLINTINVYKTEINSKKKEIDELNRSNLEIKSKGKDFLNKYNEAIIKKKEEIIKKQEEIKVLNQNLLEQNKKIEKIDIVINQMEHENNLLKEKYNSSQKINSEYLDTITLLHQQNLALEKEKKEIILQKEQLEKKVTFMFEPFSNSLNKSTSLNTSYVGNNSKEHLQLKKEYENLKKNYDELIKNLEPNKEYNISKAKKIQDLSDKLTLYAKEINEYKITIKNIVKKIKENIDINICSNYEKDKPDLKNKLESVILLVIDQINNKNVEINNLNEQKEILLNNIKTNNLKKDLVEFMNAKTSMNNEENINKDISDKIKKIREGYQSKNYENKSQKNMLLNYDLLANKENNNNSNFSQVYKRK